MTKYKVFWFEPYEEDGLYGIRIYYNGTQAHAVKSLTEQGATRKAQQWVDDEGYEWMGIE